MSLRMTRFGEYQHIAALIDTDGKAVEQPKIFFKCFASFPSHAERGHQAQPREERCDGRIKRKDVGTHHKMLQIIDRIGKGNIDGIVGCILVITSNEVLLPFRRDIFLTNRITMTNHQRTVDEVDVPLVQDQAWFRMRM